jgi:hypothetical protein
MISLSHYLHRDNHSARPRRVARQAAPVILCGAALVLAAGCSSAGTTAATSASPKAHSSGSGTSPQNATQAITAAAQTSQRIKSIAASITEHASSGTSTSTSGTVEEQLRPTLQMSMHLTTAVAGRPTSLDGVITSKVMYLKIGSLAKALGKSWIEIPLSELSNGKTSFGQLVQNLTNSDPLKETSLFTAAKNARVVGTQTIDGVSTTHYAGSYAPSQALANLPAKLRAELAPAMKAVQGKVTFNLWIDGQHQVRKVTETEQVDGQTITSTFVVTAINQPVHVTTPPPSQVAHLPTSSLGSL